MGAQGIVEGGVNAAAQEEAMGAAGVLVLPDDLAGVVDAEGLGAGGGQRIVDGGVGAAAQEKAVDADAAAGDVKADDLAVIVDAKRSGAVGGRRIVEGGISAVGGVVEEAVVAVGASNVKADDLSRVVDAQGLGEVLGGQGIGNRGVSASTQEEAVDAGIVVGVLPDDLTRAVDAVRKGAVGGQGIVQGREGIDRHGRGLLVSLAKGKSSGCRHACCGVVSNVCCDVSAPRVTGFEVSPALPPPKPAIACTS